MPNFQNKPEDTTRMLILIQGCKRHDRESQRLLYKHYYTYAMSICMRYCRTSEEAKEVLNDGFMKVFQKIDQYSSTEASFHGWIRRIMINTAIDHFRKEQKHYHHMRAEDQPVESTAIGIVDQLAHEELIAMVQQLPPAYRAAFNLYVIDGYTHKEIGEILGIAEGTSKSNLLKARECLKKMIKEKTGGLYAKSV